MRLKKKIVKLLLAKVYTRGTFTILATLFFNTTRAVRAAARLSYHLENSRPLSCRLYSLIDFHFLSPLEMKIISTQIHLKLE